MIVGGIRVGGRRLGVVTCERTSLTGRQGTAVTGTVGRKGMRCGRCRAAGFQSVLLRLEKVIVRWATTQLEIKTAAAVGKVWIFILFSAPHTYDILATADIPRFPITSS